MCWSAEAALRAREFFADDDADANANADVDADALFANLDDKIVR